MLRKSMFIPPMMPTMALSPPVGPDWLHEVKLHGLRGQIHIENGSAILYSRNGADITKQFRAASSTILGIPVDSAIIDCELVACGSDGLPSSRPLNQVPTTCLWAFDLLYLNRNCMTAIPLSDRKAALATLVAATNDPHLQFSGDFKDPIKLLQACQIMHLEGIVSKRQVSSYRSGRTRDWLMVKTENWHAPKPARREMFRGQVSQ